MRIRPILLSSFALAVVAQLALPSAASAQLGILKRVKQKAQEVAAQKAIEKVAGKPDATATTSGTMADVAATAITDEPIDEGRPMQLSTYWAARDAFVVTALVYASCGADKLRRHAFRNEKAALAYEAAVSALMERAARLAPSNRSVQSAIAWSAEALQFADSLDALQYDFALRITGNDGRRVPGDVHRTCGEPPRPPAVPAGSHAPRRSQLLGLTQE